MSIDLYELKREHANFGSALDLLYAMYVASRAEDLNREKFTAALRMVWLHMCRIEERVDALLESDEEADAAAHEA